MLFAALDFALKLNNRGTIFEFGVASGITFLQLAKRVKHLDINLVGFDSFCGLPDETCGVWRHDWHQKGEHSFDISHVQRRLKCAGLKNHQLVSGFYQESLKSEQALAIRDKVEHLLLVNIDVDLHISTLQLLDYIKPIMQRGTVLYFDDWKDPNHQWHESWGEHRAWAEWSAANPEIVTNTVSVGHNNERYMVVL